MNSAQRIHFLGIGGIGVSAIARMMLKEGKKVSGSDMAESEITRDLERLGANISIGQSVSQVPKDTDLIVYTTAIEKFDPQLMTEIRALNIPALSYPQMLNLISKTKYTVAVSGAHGKTTTTAMIAKTLIDAEKSPTVIVGSLMTLPDGSRSNFVQGTSDLFVVEACEYERNFLNLSPKILVITNIDADHLDYYKDIDDIVSAFKELVVKIPADGYLVCNTRGSHMTEVIKAAKCRIVDFSDIPLPITLKVPGTHNISNAKAALAVAKSLGADETKALASLADFNGTWRRFEFKGQTASGALVYDDYAHHPKEIAATIQGARELYPAVKVVAVFQPHLYSRTKSLLDEFAGALAAADEVILAPIYPAREVFDPSITSEMIVGRIPNGKARVVQSFEEIQNILSLRGKDSLILVMGAGSITDVARNLTAK